MSYHVVYNKLKNYTVLKNFIQFFKILFETVSLFFGKTLLIYARKRRKISLQQLALLKKIYPYSRIQLQKHELVMILNRIINYDKCNLLVFGVGWDSISWNTVNGKGNTVFIEEDKSWMKTIQSLDPELKIKIFKYTTELKDWKHYLKQPEVLDVALPEQIERERFDVIIVDGPNGNPHFKERFGKEPPGRMISIYKASKLIKKGGSVFIHDCERLVERTYAERFFKKNDFLLKINGILREYKKI